MRPNVKTKMFPPLATQLRGQVILMMMLAQTKQLVENLRLADGHIPALDFRPPITRQFNINVGYFLRKIVARPDKIGHIHDEESTRSNKRAKRTDDRIFVMQSKEKVIAAPEQVKAHDKQQATVE
jgi:hypothetical protein